MTITLIIYSFVKNRTFWGINRRVNLFGIKIYIRQQAIDVLNISFRHNILYNYAKYFTTDLSKQDLLPTLLFFNRTFFNHCTDVKSRVIRYWGIVDKSNRKAMNYYKLKSGLDSLHQVCPHTIPFGNNSLRLFNLVDISLSSPLDTPHRGKHPSPIFFISFHFILICFLLFCFINFLFILLLS